MQEPIVIQVETGNGKVAMSIAPPWPNGHGRKELCDLVIDEKERYGLTRDESTRLRDALNMILNQNR